MVISSFAAERAAVSLELEVSYGARRPWAPRRAQFARWAHAALSMPAPRRAVQAERGGRARRAARPVPGAHILLSVSVIGAARSRTLNARYRGKDRPTNVLSFGGAGTLPDGRHFLGELVMCAPVVAREAQSQGKSAEAHWAHLTVHGVLHLLGFDHERRAEAGKMAAREIQVLDRLGFANPYA
jgi:probable rRNA maturation factor